MSSTVKLSAFAETVVPRHALFRTANLSPGDELRMSSDRTRPMSKAKRRLTQSPLKFAGWMRRAMMRWLIDSDVLIEGNGFVAVFSGMAGFVEPLW